MTRSPLHRTLILAALTAASTFACVCTREGKKDDKTESSSGGDVKALVDSFSLAQDTATADVGELTKAPHPAGSARQTEITAWLEKRVKDAGSTVKREAFDAEMPNPAALDATGPVAQTVTKASVNLWAVDNVKADAPCVVALASHYDTKDIQGLAYVGANDSGSSTATLVQQVAWLKAQAATLAPALVCDVVGVWFDAEEALLPNWTDGEYVHPAKIQDNTYGSRHAASRLTDCTYEGAKAKCLPADLGGKPLVALILMDMIGSPSLQISRDGNSTAKLADLAEQAARAFGQPEAYDDRVHGVEDDHVPYLRAGVPALDLIDFNHLAYWHRDGDEAANISYESMGLAGKIALFTALSVAKDPKVFASPAE